MDRLFRLSRAEAETLAAVPLICFPPFIPPDREELALIVIAMPMVCGTGEIVGVELVGWMDGTSRAGGLVSVPEVGNRV